ncbi:MAG TPA: pectin acetylesterase-family hydrolase [Candidatus Limnocylindrales bacterium]|nr:pectin acetylesterase-family hydrolase [Candidatus Limnocylindrales bacterium]
MIRTRTLFATALVSVAVAATSAQAGPYPANVCVAKKQQALGKHAAAVAKALAGQVKTGEDPTADIAASQAKLDAAWDKTEATAAKKSSSCDEATSSSEGLGLDVTGLVQAAVAGLTSGLDLNDDDVSACVQKQIGAIGKYLSAATKAHGKYIKDPSKDADKAILNASLSELATALDATLDAIVADAGVACAAGDETAMNEALADALSEVHERTTTAPDYPTTAQTIVPGSTVPYLGKDLKPACVDGDPYLFFARRGHSGDENKILMYYQGGGACWNNASCFGIGTCSRTADAGDNPELVGTGFADLDNPDNPFRNWSVVFVTYCSCDVHWGGANSTTYGSGSTAYHRGRTNAAVVEKWAREHFLDPEAVFVTGSSAGSYGAIMNSYYLIRDVWPSADFSVLGDGGVGVITKEWLDSYIQSSWKVEEVLPTDIPGVEPPVTQLSIVELTNGLAARFPNARFAHYDSSYDGGGGSQCNFFQVMKNPDNVAAWGNWWVPTCQWNQCMRDFKSQIAAASPNYRYFTGAGSRHTMFGSDKIYTETKSRDADGNPVRILDFVNAMISNTGWVNADCNNTGGDCNLTNSCQGGTNAGGLCTSGADCPGGSCENDPDTSNAPYANNDTVTCAPTICDCNEVNCAE